MRIQDLIKALTTEGPPKHQRTLHRIVELRMQGKGMAAIAEILNTEGHTGRLGGKWFFVSVRRQLEGLGLGTQSPNTCWCWLEKGTEAPELGDTWSGKFRQVDVTGVVEEIKGRKVLIRPNDWIFPSTGKTE